MTEPAITTGLTTPAYRARLWWLAYALALALLPIAFGSSFALTLLSQIGIASIACLSLNILLGQGGMLSFGHALYTGAGAYAAIHLLRLASNGWAVPVSLMPALAGVCSLLLALLTGWLSTRRAGLSFAMITLGLGELAWTLAQRFPAVFGGEAGLTANRVVGEVFLGLSFGPGTQVYGLIAVYAWVCTVLMFAFTRTPLAWGLRAVREQPERAGALGFDPRNVRYRAVLVSAFFAGVAGGLAALQFEIVTSEVFSVTRSGAYLLFTVVGGAGYFLGPMVGAVLMVLGSVWLSSITGAWQLYLGLLFVATVMLVPDGLSGLAVRLWQRWQARGWRLLEPADVLQIFAALTMLMGLTALVEMLYQFQLRSTMGSQLTLWGLTLNTSEPASWVACALVSCTGLTIWRWCQRRGGT